MSDPAGSPWRAHLATLARAPSVPLTAVGIIGALGLGYWSSTRTPGPTIDPGPPSLATEAVAPVLSPVDIGPEPSADIPQLPVLNEAAITARTTAQRRLLGSELFEDEPGHALPWITTMAKPSPSPADPLLDNLPGSSGLGGPIAAVGSSGVNGNALGLFVPIERGSERGSPLEHFYRALDQLQRGEDPDGKVRVLVYGGSHTDADIYPQYIRTYLQQRFGDGGHGFIHIAKPWPWYRHADYRVEGAQYWFTEHAQRRQGRRDGRYGFMGASLSGRSRRATGRIVPRGDAVGSVYELFFLRQPKGGSVELLVDGQRQTVVKTRADDIGPGYHQWVRPERQHTIELKLRGDGEVRLFGMTIERQQPGVVVDTLGIGGTRAANMLQWDQDIWADNLLHRAPDLVMFFYGTNEATDEDQPIEHYQRDLQAVLDRLAIVAPYASCLLMGPGDFPLKQGDGTWVNRPRIDEIIAVQRAVAAEHGCGFWDTKAFMGGELSMPMWVQAQPAMAKPDHIHFTKRGYVRIGMAVVDAMMVGFDERDIGAESSRPPV